MPEAVNPYIAGSPITGSEMFFGREDVFEFVKRTLSGKHRDNPIVLYGQRRTGKTSVLYHIGRHLDPNYLCLFIDLHALAIDGVSGLLWDLASYIVRGLRRDYGIEVPRPDRAEFAADARDHFRNEFLGSVKAAIGDRHLLLMLDEVGRLHEKIQAGELDTSVFEYLRHLMQHYDWLDFLYSLGSSLEEMQQEYSLLFSVAMYKQISFLDREAATQLITRPIQNQYRIEPAAMDRILDITSGHPYYTQLVCHCLFSRWQQKPVDSMGVQEVEAVLDLAIELGSANLKFVWEQSSPGEKAVMAGLAARAARRSGIRDVHSAWSALDVTLPEAETAKAIRSLRARDILAGDDRYRFAVDLQRRWVKQQRRLDWVKEEVSAALPDWRAAALQDRTHRRRFSRAAWIGLVAAAVVGALLSWVVIHRWQRQPSRTSKIETQAGQGPGPSGEEPDLSEGSNQTVNVPQLARLYDFPAEFDGRGQCIGIIELAGGYRDADLKAYFDNLHLPVPSVSWVPVDGGKNDPGNSGVDGQVELNIEVVGAVAPGARLVLYFAPNTDQGFVDSVGAAINDRQNHPSVVLIAWGQGEAAFSPAFVRQMNANLHASVARNVTVCVAAGDQGVTNGVDDGHAHVDFPASSPWVLAVGGTALTASGNAIQAEKVWNDGSGFATGGGVSALFPVPAWQVHAGVPPSINPGGRAGRGVPDVAAHGDPQSGYQVIIDGVHQIVGGTGGSASLWAGLIAIMNQALGRDVGFFNPVLYGELGPAGVLRSITEGNNSSPKLRGYAAGAGWNPCTGWGSPDGRELLNALRAHFSDKNVDDSALMLPPRNTGAEASTVGFAVAEAVEYQIRKTLGKEVRISPRYLYYYARLQQGTADQDTGAIISNAIDAVRNQGAIPEDAWPYVAGQYAAKPPDLKGVETYRIKNARPLKNVYDVIAALQSTGPVVAGIQMYKSAWSPQVKRTGIIPMPTATDQRRGGHAICIVGYDNQQQRLKFLNDWGPDWGDHGYGYLPYAYINKYAAEMWEISM